MTWAWDKLFADVSSQMQSEWFPGKEGSSEASEAPGSSLEKNERPYTAFNKFPV